MTLYKIKMKNGFFFKLERKTKEELLTDLDRLPNDKKDLIIGMEVMV